RADLANERARIKREESIAPDCRCSRAGRMEKRTRSRRASHFCSGVTKANGRTRSQQTDGGLLRQRISFEHCGQHFETGWVQRIVERPRKLGSVEESETS